MVMYDCLLTFSREVQLFWREPSNGLGGTIIFALNRLTAIGLVVVGHLNVDLTSYTLARYTLEVHPTADAGIC